MDASRVSTVDLIPAFVGFREYQQGGATIALEGNRGLAVGEALGIDTITDHQGRFLTAHKHRASFNNRHRVCGSPDPTTTSSSTWASFSPSDSFSDWIR